VIEIPKLDPFCLDLEVDLQFSADIDYTGLLSETIGDWDDLGGHAITIEEDESAYVVTI